MASNLNEILGRNIDSVKALKTAIKELQDSLVGLDTDSEQFKTTTAQLAVAQAELNKVTKAGKDENVAAKDSLVGMRQEYKALYDQYKLLTEEQRKSDFGKVMADSLETLSNKINDTQKGIGDFRGNVGRYAQSITDAFNGMGISLGALQTPLKLATGGANTFGKALKTLAANPIILILTVLVAILVKAAEAIKKNEELTMRLQQAMSAFRPILDAVSNAFDFLAEKLVSFVEWLGNATQKIREFGAAITDWLGITENAKKEVQEQNRIYQSLAKSQNELTKMRRDYLKLNSESQKNLDNLRSEAAATTDLTEKKKLLTEAQALQEEINNRNLEIAQEELRILEEQASLTANDAAMNEKLAAAQAKVNDVQAEGARKMKELNEQLKSTNSTIKTTTTSITNYREEARKLYEELVENNKDELTKLTEKYDKEKKLLEKYHYDTTLLTKKYNTDVAKLTSEAAKTRVENRKQQMNRELDDEARHYQNQQQLERNELEREIKNLETIAGKLAGVRTEFDNLKKDATFGNLFDTIFKEGQYDMVGSLDYAVKIMPELKDKLTELGEDGFDGLSSSLQRLLGQLQNTHGITIKNIKDLQDNMALIDQQVDDFKNKARIALVADMQKAYAEQQAENTAEYYKHFLYKLAEAGGTDGSFYDFFGQFETNFFAAAEFQTSALTAEYEALDKRREILAELLEDDQLTADARMEILTDYTSVLEEMTARQQALVDLNNERTNQMWDSLIGWSDGMASALGTVKGSYESVIDSEVKAGKIDENEARKKKERLQKLEKIQTAFSIATIAADAAAGIFTVWKGYATETGVINPQTAAAAGPGAAVALGALNAKSLISAIAKTASLAATAAAQIAAARNGQIASNNNFAAEGGGGGGSVSVGATPALIDSSSYTYAREMQTLSAIDEMNNRQYFVSVVDIESALNQKVIVTDESSF